MLRLSNLQGDKNKALGRGLWGYPAYPSRLALHHCLQRHQELETALRFSAQRSVTLRDAGAYLGFLPLCRQSRSNIFHAGLGSRAALERCSCSPGLLCFTLKGGPKQKLCRVGWVAQRADGDILSASFSQAAPGLRLCGDAAERGPGPLRARWAWHQPPSEQHWGGPGGEGAVPNFPFHPLLAGGGEQAGCCSSNPKEGDGLRGDRRRGQTQGSRKPGRKLTLAPPEEKMWRTSNCRLIASPLGRLVADGGRGWAEGREPAVSQAGERSYAGRLMLKRSCPGLQHSPVGLLLPEKARLSHCPPPHHRASPNRLLSCFRFWPSLCTAQTKHEALAVYEEVRGRRPCCV